MKDVNTAERPNVTINFVHSDGETTQVKVKTGSTLMEVAVQSDITEIEAKCFGNCCCVTCHVLIDESWIDSFPSMTEMEESMLDFGEKVDHRSRLSCQLLLKAEHDGLIVDVPSEQRVLGL
jgi:2Fe-2S ferredoxin